MTQVTHSAAARSLLDRAIAQSLDSSPGKPGGFLGSPGTLPCRRPRGRGRDSSDRRDLLLAAWMRLPFDRTLAIHVLNARLGDPSRSPWPSVRGTRSRAAAEADPVDEALIVMIAAELWRWGTPWGDIAGVLPRVDRALDRIVHADRDRDGFVERGSTGVAWAEDQGYVYAAYRARATLARASGDPDTAACWDDAAQGIQQHANHAFWLPAAGGFASALDSSNNPVTVAGAEIGQCLWTGLIDEDKAGALVTHLLSSDTFCGWGLQSRADADELPDPGLRVIRPHENAIVAAGLARYGYRTEAFRVAQTQLAAADSFAGLLPASFLADPRTAVGAPHHRRLDPLGLRRGAPQECASPYPPTASSAATPLLLLRALLGLDANVPEGTVHLRPAVPACYLPLTVEDVLIGQERVTVRLPASTDEPPTVSGLPEHVSLAPERLEHHPLTLTWQTATSLLARGSAPQRPAAVAHN